MQAIITAFLSILWCCAAFSRLARYPSALTSSAMNKPGVLLPKRVIVGYANWNQCDDSIVEAVKQGVNVVIWFSINLSFDAATSSPIITNGPDWDCVAQLIAKIRGLGLETVHLISIGGWNSPHPDCHLSGESAFEAWHKWNTEVISRPEHGFLGFDGFDWDLEGNDDPKSQYNSFSIQTLHLMGDMSRRAKQSGYLVAMAPAESYFDPHTAPVFSRSLLFEYDEWKNVLPTPFAYHGRNVYTFLEAFYGTTRVTSQLESNELSEMVVPTFDFVTVQLYEGYSHVLYKIAHTSAEESATVVDTVRRLSTPFLIDFATDSELADDLLLRGMRSGELQRFIHVPLDRLVIGVANGWAGDGKFLLLRTRSLSEAEESLCSAIPRGYAFWNILDEGRVVDGQPLFIAQELNAFVQTRRS